MANIWRNRLLAHLAGESTKTFADVPNREKEAVKALLRNDVVKEIITPEQYETLVGEEYKAA